MRMCVVSLCLIFLIFGGIQGQEIEELLTNNDGLESLIATGNKLKVVEQMNHPDFLYENEAQRQADIDSGNLVPYNSLAIDVDVYYSSVSNKRTIFVVTPRFQTGVPVTLGTLSNQLKDGDPLIAPYPDWSWHRNPNECKADRMVSVFRVMIDKCNRLWVLDNGKINGIQVCPPQILAFDLETNEVVHRHEIKEQLWYDRPLLVTPVVDVRATCDDVFVYAADCVTNSIFVHDVKSDTTWVAKDKTMFPDPAYGSYSIRGETFEFMDGVLGMALSPYEAGGDRKLFYHAMSSASEQYVLTSKLRNSTIFKDNSLSSPQLFYKYSKTRGTQSVAEAISKDGIMFFGLVGDVKMACFNIRDDYSRLNFGIVGDNPDEMQFPSGVKVITNLNGEEELWVLTSRFQKAMNGNYPRTGPNFRILSGKVKNLIAGTKCYRRSFFGK